MNQEIKIVLPLRYNLVVGDTFQLFYRGIIEAPDPFVYDILLVCEKGKAFPRYFEFTPEEEGEHILTVSVFDAKKKLLGTNKTILSVKAPKKNTHPLNVLCMGDSLTAGGQWPAEAKRRLTSKGGVPFGVGFDNVNFVGTCRSEDVHTGFEGYGGWLWKSFYSIENNNIWVRTSHNKNVEDQHSVWKDEGGNEWKLETLDINRLKFLPYGNNSGIKPEKGKLVHVANALHTDDIVFTDSWFEKRSPFYDESIDDISFKAYSERIGVDRIDAIYIMLGLNGLLDVKGDILGYCSDVISQAKVLIDIFHRDFPEGKIKIMGTMMPSVTGGIGANYGAVMPYCDGYNLRRFVLHLNELYQELANEKTYCDFVEHINISGQFDSDNNFPEVEKPVNTRSKKTEKIGVNGLHPSNEGYMQIADAAFRNMVHLCNDN